MTGHVLLGSFGALGVLCLLIQLVPYQVSNPAVRQEPAWDRPETADAAKRACYDCHSNQVKVPWYGHVAPVAWLVRYHVDEAREELNFSEMDRPQKEAHEAGEEVLEGEMPPLYYLALHPEARLSDAERKQLAAGLNATLGSEGEHDEAGSVGRHRHRDDDDHDDDDDD